MFVKVLLNSKKMKSGIFGAESNSRPRRGALVTEQKPFSHTNVSSLPGVHTLMTVWLIILCASKTKILPWLTCSVWQVSNVNHRMAGMAGIVFLWVFSTSCQAPVIQPTPSYKVTRRLSLISGIKCTPVNKITTLPWSASSFTSSCIREQWLIAFPMTEAYNFCFHLWGFIFWVLCVYRGLNDEGGLGWNWTWRSRVGKAWSCWTEKPSLKFQWNTLKGVGQWGHYWKTLHLSWVILK